MKARCEVFGFVREMELPPEMEFVRLEITPSNLAAIRSGVPIRDLDTLMLKFVLRQRRIDDGEIVADFAVSADQEAGLLWGLRKESTIRELSLLKDEIQELAREVKDSAVGARLQAIEDRLKRLLGG